MKKLLIATTALVAGASAAAADVTISGYGRFGLQYIEDRGGIGSDEENTQIASRLRMNIDATTETDVGVTFGARFRIQHDSGESAGEDGGETNRARFSVGYEGFNVQVGNVDTAADSVALTYGSEMGFDDNSFGDSQGGFFAYDSDTRRGEFTGIAATYSVSGVNLYLSYVDTNQESILLGEEEIGVAADWTNGQLSVAASYTDNAAGVADDEHIFVGAAYTFGEATVGLNYYDWNEAADDLNQVTIYGTYALGATTLRAYVSEIDVPGVDTDTAFGLGADYSLGEGARLSGSVHSGFGDNFGDNQGTRADLGVRFDF